MFHSSSFDLGDGLPGLTSLRYTKGPLSFDSLPACVFAAFTAGRNRGTGDACSVSSLCDSRMGLDFMTHTLQLAILLVTSNPARCPETILTGI